jgi:hypothetical protein
MISAWRGLVADNKGQCPTALVLFICFTWRGFMPFGYPLTARIQVILVELYALVDLSA